MRVATDSVELSTALDGLEVPDLASAPTRRSSSRHGAISRACCQAASMFASVLVSEGPIMSKQLTLFNASPKNRDSLTTHTHTHIIKQPAKTTMATVAVTSVP